MIPDETIERIRESADIVQVIGEYVELRRTGADYRGPCPFHQGTNRNFSVSPKKKIYYCFVCHEGGDVFTFLQKRLGVDWPASVKMVAEKSGIEVREVERDRREGPDPRARFWEMNAAAAEYFTRYLWEELGAGAARDYLAQRGISEEVANRFALGFAPREIGLMRAALNSLGYDDEALLEGGLMVKREENTEPRPRFRGRLMFPILDAMGRHVGFGGRVIGEGEPKYLNSPETPVFSKGKLLYGLNVSKLAARREERMLVVEGYFDVVRLMAAGVDEVVAPLGTALTEEQARLVTRYAKKVYLLYDADAPGQKAAFRSGDELLRQGAAVHVVTLPEGEDPDSYVAKHGAEGLRARLGEAVDLFERKVQILERAGWFGDLAGKRRALDRLLPTIRATADPLMRDIYIARASEASGVSRELLAEEAKRVTTPRASQIAADRPRPRRDDFAAPDGAPELEGPPPGMNDGPPPEQEFVPQRPFLKRRGDRRGNDRRGGWADERPAIRGWGKVTSKTALVERELLRALFHQRPQLEVVAEKLGTDGFRVPAYRRIFATLLEAGEDAPLDAIAGKLAPEDVATMQEQLLVEPEAVGDAASVIVHSINKLRAFEIEEELAALEERRRAASGEAQDALQRRIQQLGAEMRELGLKGLKTEGFRKRRA
ncbi:MAG: DNA primase [Gemmatimonadaceae bacterium]|nr:DNA primase [Gemmatimonadaceae bacterium]NUQ92656.1 DNA primase [Gemmatimonadaceae bacterium]